MVDYQGQRFVFEGGARLAHGGMAEVYMGARKDAPDIHVALKVPLSHLPSEVQSLFLREAEAAACVASPYVVRVIDWGTAPPFIAFEFVDGHTLATELQQRHGARQFYTEAELLGLYRQLVAAMTAVNAHVIHRDLKPANIFCADDTLKVGDFGIAKYADEVTRSKTFKGWGTTAYMAPEAFRNESVDWRADQYSLGVIFYELATLQRPFVGPDAELEHAHLFQRPPRVTTVASSLSERLASLVAKMLEKRPEQRFPSWDALADELGALGRGLPTASDEVAEDPLARTAAGHIERVRQQQLEAERRDSERQATMRWRSQLRDYWAEEFFEAITARVDKLNQSLGAGTIRMSQQSRMGGAGSSQEGPRELHTSFLNASLTLHLASTPPNEAGDVPVWGYIRLKTNHRGWLGNLVLTDQPPPYGTWQEVDMRLSVYAPANFQPGEKTGERYEMFGDDRLVLALTWQALAAQRAKRHIMSGVNYGEQPLDFAAVLDQLLTVFVEDAHHEPRPKRTAGRP